MAQAENLLGVAQAPRRARQLSLLAVDHWYDCSRIWRLAGCPPGPGFAQGFARHASWYRQQDKALSMSER
jgi:hypothetical protein